MGKWQFLENKKSRKHDAYDLWKIICANNELDINTLPNPLFTLNVIIYYCGQVIGSVINAPLSATFILKQEPLGEVSITP